MKGETQTVKASTNDISAAALKVFSREELVQLPRPQRLSLMNLMAKRLEAPGQPATLDVLKGIKALVAEHLWHPALNDIVPLKDNEP